MPLTINTSGYIEVYRDGVFISRHSVETNAVEAIVAHAEANGDGDYELRFPNKVVMSRLKKTVIPFVWSPITASFVQGTASTVNLAGFISNPENRVLTYAAVGALPTGVTLTGSTLSYNGTAAAASATPRFTASSGQLVATSAPASVSIAVAPPANRTPVWSGSDPITLAAVTNSTQNDIPLAGYASDPDGDTLTYSRTGGTAPSGVTVNGSTGVLTIPLGTTAGGWTVIVRAADASLSATRTFSVTVQSAQAGAFAHGDLVTITGTGFGATMPTFGFAGGAAGPLELTALGATPSSPANGGGGPSSVAGFNWQRFSDYATVGTDASRGKVLTWTGSGTYDESSQEYRFVRTVPENGRLMVKYWARYSATGAGQYKFARLQAGTSDISDTNHNQVWTYNTGIGGSMAYANSAGGVAGSDTWYMASANASLAALDGVWRRVERKIIAGTQGVRDGQTHIRAYATVAPQYADRTSVAGYYLRSQVMSYPDSSRYIAYTWQNWYGNGYSGASFAIDDHFVQIDSFACVELWNTADPATATVREIQEPTAWSDTSITVRLNRGGLPNGTYYLVVLADSVIDTVLASRQITIA